MAERADGSEAFVIVEQLDRPRPLFSIPLGHDVRREDLDGGGELLLDDFFADGSRSTVLLATADGLLVYAAAMSATAPSLAGWPTTTANVDPPGPPEPAPLTIDELAVVVRRLARDVTG